MAAHGLEERRATLAKLQTINSGRAFQGSLDDAYEVPRDPSSGRALPHVIVDFGAPVRTARDRNLAKREQGQPHVLPANIACVAGNADDAQLLMAAVFTLLVDWEPSATSDAWEAKGGYGTRRPATQSTPTRFVEGLFLEAVTNQGIDA
ncbi:hypothetical protein [Streptomyces sp. AC495_CC817]|uniref:hypothetical protein n=1 Tax=Streptomyces sp. AC495_CC817 TaxID=2823900 RepID=UPI001C254C9D|nr:hypothetical protein [Streptomyces sp. AC495_CC817]